MGESKFLTRADLARSWHAHLVRDDWEARDRIYDKVLDYIDRPNAPSVDKYVSEKTACFWLRLTVE